MKKHICLLIAFALLFTGAFPAFAENTIAYETFTEVPADWTTSTSLPATNPSVTAQGGALVLRYHTTTAAVGRAEITTTPINFTSGLLYVRVSLGFSGYASNTSRTVALRDNSALNQQILARVTGGELTLLGGAQTVLTVTEGETVDLAFALNLTNPQDASATVLVNGVQSFLGKFTLNTLDFSALKLRMSNTSVGALAIESAMRVHNVLMQGQAPMTHQWNVQDGSVLEEEAISRAVLSYSGIPLPRMLEQENFTLSADGEPVEFDLEAAEGAVSLAPLGGWRSFAQYTLTAGLIGDVFGSLALENVSVSFMFVAEGVTLPKAEFASGQPAAFKEGEWAEITAHVTGGSFDEGWFLVSGAEHSRFTQSPAVIQLSPGAGTYTVQAVVRQGEYQVKSAPLTLTFAPNPPPTVRFLGYTGQVNAAPGEIGEIGIEAADEDGIARVAVYLNGQMIGDFSAPPYVADVTSAGIGDNLLRAVAWDGYGKSAEARLTISVRSSKETVVLQDGDFAKRTNTLTESGISMNSQRGYVVIDTVDEAKGPSLLVGIETANESYTSGNLPFAAFSTGAGKSHLILECDVYVGPDQKENSGDKRITLKKDGSTDMAIVTIGERMVIGSASLDYTLRTWYHLKFDIDIPTGKWDAYRDGVQVVTGASLISGMDSADFIRIYGPRNDVIPSYTAVDNIVLKVFYDIPRITGVGSGGPVALDGEIGVQLSAPLYAPSISTETVSLWDEDFGRVPLASALWDAAASGIVIKPAARLASNAAYTVRISEKAKFNQSMEIGSPIVGSFVTVKEGFEVLDVSFQKSGSRLNAALELENTGGQPQTVYCVLTLWQGTLFAGQDITAVSLAAGAAGAASLRTELPAGAVAEVCVYDSLAVPRLLSKRVYSYQ